MSDHLTIDKSYWPELFKIIADECNVKQITINGQVVHQEPLLKDKYKAKQKQFDEIYSEYSDDA